LAYARLFAPVLQEETPISSRCRPTKGEAAELPLKAVLVLRRHRGAVIVVDVA